MPVSVEERTGRKVSGTITLPDGETIKIKYYPDRISGKLLKNIISMAKLLDSPSDVENAMGVADACDESAAFIVTIIAEWDLLQTRKPLVIAPLTVENVSNFGLQLLFDILTGLVSIVQLGEAIGTPSSTRSPRISSAHSNGSSNRSVAVSRSNSSKSKLSAI